MSARFVDDAERLTLLREHIKVAMEIVETFRVAYEDHIVLDYDKAVAELDEALNRLACAHTDTYSSIETEEDAYKFDAVYHGKPKLFTESGIDDGVI